jgi:hypothetical protein
VRTPPHRTRAQELAALIAAQEADAALGPTIKPEHRAVRSKRSHSQNGHGPVENAGEWPADDSEPEEADAGAERGGPSLDWWRQQIADIPSVRQRALVALYLFEFTDTEIGMVLARADAVPITASAVRDSRRYAERVLNRILSFAPSRNGWQVRTKPDHSD